MKPAIMNLSKTSSGFTLIELMVTIAVLGIIASIAAPNISTQLANSRVKSTTTTLENALKEARAESLIRRQDVEVEIDDRDYQVKIKDNHAALITGYDYSDKSRIDGDVDTTFHPNKTASEATFVICDSNTVASSYQVTVGKIGQISAERGGTC